MHRPTGWTDMTTPVVIVGSGLAGYNVAREFRKLDKETPLVVVSRDHAGFYSKPMLSNALAGNKTAATLVMKPAEKMAAEINATMHANTGVQRIDTACRRRVAGKHDRRRLRRAFHRPRRHAARLCADGQRYLATASARVDRPRVAGVDHERPAPSDRQGIDVHRPTQDAFVGAAAFGAQRVQLRQPARQHALQRES